MATKINNRKDVLLLLLYSPGCFSTVNEPIVGRTRLVKMLFLFRKEMLAEFRKGTEINNDNFYEFFPWNFGPFSRDVYDDVTFFILREFIGTSASSEEMTAEAMEEYEEWLTESGEDSPRAGLREFEEESFSLTEKGISFTKKLYESLSGQQQTMLKEFKQRTNSAPLRAILRYVYTKYPEQTENSQIKGNILGY